MAPPYLPMTIPYVPPITTPIPWDPTIPVTTIWGNAYPGYTAPLNTNERIIFNG